MKLFLVVAFLVPIFSFAQTIVKDKVDDFNGARIVTTSDEKISKAKYPFINIACFVVKDDKTHGSDTSTVLYFFFHSGVVTAVNNESALDFKFDDGTILKLTHKGERNVVSSDNLADIYSDLNDNDIELLKSKKVVKMRIETSEENIDLDIDSKYQDIFSRCITIATDRVKTKPV